MLRVISILGVSISVFFYSCSTNKETKSPEKNDSSSITKEVTKSIKLTDTLEQNGYRFYIQFINPNELSSIKTHPYSDEIAKIKIKCPEGKGDCPDKVEEARINLLTDSNFALREGKNLKLRLKDSTYTTFSNNITDGDDYAAYYFMKYVEDIGIYILEAHYYEERELIILNANNGEKIAIEGNDPVISPDRNRFIITSTLFSIGDPEAITVFEIKGNAIKKILGYTKEWGASEARWIDNNTIKIEQEIGAPDGTSVQEKDKKYCKLIILHQQ